MLWWGWLRVPRPHFSTLSRYRVVVESFRLGGLECQWMVHRVSREA